MLGGGEGCGGHDVVKSSSPDDDVTAGDLVSLYLTSPNNARGDYCYGKRGCEG